jgi:hypothetical protein
MNSCHLSARRTAIPNAAQAMDLKRVPKKGTSRTLHPLKPRPKPNPFVYGIFLLQQMTTVRVKDDQMRGAFIARLIQFFIFFLTHVQSPEGIRYV